jgi:hypothetical protein
VILKQNVSRNRIHTISALAESAVPVDIAGKCLFARRCRTTRVPGKKTGVIH